jgi:anti-sigma-28 factor FlgM
VTDLPARTVKLNALKDRIARDEYAVDVDAVADALIRRMRDARAATPHAAVSRNGARSRAPRAARRLR